MAKLPIPFSNPRTYAGHSGVDFGQARGTPIPASGPGKVSHWGYSTRGGYYLWVRYDSGPLVSYHHMDSHRGCPRAGSRVVEGTRLGYVGSKGQNSTGPHLHSEVAGYATTTGYWKFFDPNRVVGARPAGDDTTPISPDKKPERRNTMTTLFQHEGKTLFALAGDSPGTEANWQETTGQAHANELARSHGNAVVLSAGTWALRKRQYSSPLKTTAVIDSTTIAKAISDALASALGGLDFPTAEAIGKASVKALADELNN